MRNPSLPTIKIAEFKRRFEEYVKRGCADCDYAPVFEVDALVHPSNIKIRTAEEFTKLEPCGVGNSVPIFACGFVNCTAAKVIGTDKSHLSFAIIGETLKNHVIGAVVVCIVSAFFTIV